MSERTLWLGIKAEAKQKVNAYDVRISGIRQQLRSLLVASNPIELNDVLIQSLAVDLRAAKIEYNDALKTYIEACRELGEDPV